MKVKVKCPICKKKTSVDKKTEKFLCPACNSMVIVGNQLIKDDAVEDLVSVIKYEGNGETLIWKHPIENFNMGTQLIVHESQEAIFFKDGQALDLFGAGRYTLETSQLPILGKYYKLPVDAETTFQSSVYFVNLSHQMAVRWGTPNKINLVEPSTQAPISLGARGMYNFKISNSRKLLLKLLGTANGLTREDLFGVNSNTHEKDYFRSIVQVGVASKLAAVIRENNIDILQIDEEKLRISELLKEALEDYFDDYGMKITEFVLEGVILPTQGELGYEVVQTLIEVRKKNLKKTIIETEAEIKLSEMETQKKVDVRAEENAVEVELARRQTVVAKGETNVIETQLEGQKEITRAQAETAAERLRMQLEMERKAQMAQIEAQEMRAKGYTQKDVIQGDVFKAFAENQLENSAVGSMTSVAGQAVNMGANFAAMGAMAGMATNMIGTGAKLGREMTDSMSGVIGGIQTTGNNISNNGSQNTSPENIMITAGTWGEGSGGWNCICGKTGIQSKFCPDCGAKKPEENIMWKCPNCGKENISSKFCPDCGTKK